MAACSRNPVAVPCWKRIKQAADSACLLDDSMKVCSRNPLTVSETQDRIFRSLLDQEIVEFLFVLEVGFGFSPCQFEQGRLGNVEVAGPDNLGHLPEEKCQQESPYVSAVDIGVRHDDDLVVPEFFQIEIVLAEAGAEGGGKVLDLLAVPDLVRPGPFYVQDLSSKRQYGLVFP